MRQYVFWLTLMLICLLCGCTNRNVGASTNASCTVKAGVISCPDGTEYVIPVPINGSNGSNGQNGQDGEDGEDGSTIVVTIVTFPDTVICRQLNATTWAKRSPGTDIKLYALATCTGASSASMTHTGDEIFWSVTREFYIMDTLTTMQKVSF